MDTTNSKNLWKFDFYYSLPDVGGKEDDEVEWSDYSEQLYILLPASISDAEDAQAFIESNASPPSFFFAGFTRVSTTNQ